MTESAEKLERLLQSQLRQKWIFNAALGVEMGDGSFAWAGAAGVTDPERGSPMRADSPYFIASVTKIFTATAVMLLHEQGKVELDARVAEYITPEMLEGLHDLKDEDHTRNLKVHHLLSHTSGLADYFEERDLQGRTFVQTLLQEGDTRWTREDLLARVRTDLQPKFAPAPDEGAGQNAHYSDTNYQLLGAILESVTGKSVGQVFHELLFAPLGLADTYVFGDDAAGADREPPATMFYKDEPFVVPQAMTAFGPNGGIVSTLADQLKLLRAMFKGHLFEQPGTLQRMQQWNKLFFPVEYGFGLMRYKLPRWMSPFQAVPEFVGHSGSIGSFAFYCTDRDFFVAGTVNQVAARATPFRIMPKVAGVIR